MYQGVAAESAVTEALGENGNSAFTDGSVVKMSLRIVTAIVGCSYCRAAKSCFHVSMGYI